MGKSKEQFIKPLANFHENTPFIEQEIKCRMCF